VLVTGATGGIGRAAAVAFAGAGADLVLTARSLPGLERLAAATGGAVLAADLTVPGAVEGLAAAAGDVDVLVANAAVPASGPLADYGAAELEAAVELNLTAPIRLVHALLPGMLERARGHLLLVSSLQGLAATPGAPLYVATKFALRGFALALRQDLRGTGVGAGVLLPGFVRDAGMFAASGVRLPPGVGTRSPEQVGAAAVRAVATGRAETLVAPLPLAVGSRLAGSFPSLPAGVQGALGARRLAGAIAAGQRRSRSQAPDPPAPARPTGRSGPED